MREILICILGSILGLSVMVNIILLASTWSAMGASTSNLLTNDFTDGSWTGTNQSTRHGDNIIAGVNGQYVESEVQLNDHLLTPEIQGGFTSTLTADVWVWNSLEQTTKIIQNIESSSGETVTQTITIDDVCAAGWNGCGYETSPENIVIVPPNTETNYSLTSRFEFSVPSQSSGHYGSDLRNPNLVVDYTAFSLSFDNDITDIAENIEETITFDAFEFEQDFDFIFLEPVEPEMFIEIAPEILLEDNFFLSDDYMEFGFDETITFDEPMDMTLEEMPMEMPMGMMYDDAPMMDLYSDDNMMTMYTDEPMPEDILLMPLPMVYDDEEVIVADEPEQEMIIIEEEYIEEFEETEMVETTPTDEQLQEFPDNEPMLEEEFVEEQEIEEAVVEEEIMLVEEEVVVIEETPSVEVVQQDRPSVNVKVKFSDIVLADLNKINVIISSQQMIEDKPFYAPQNIYTVQPVLVDNRQIYQNVAMTVDPLVVHQKKLVSNRLKQAELKFKLERLHGIN
tara:strand:+ start:3053 stop:4579 length:1527 start_codon:yes stop_codon:yes gene_type:complete